MSLKRAMIFLLIPSCLFSAAKFDGTLSPAARGALEAFGAGGAGSAADLPMTLSEKMMAEGEGFFAGKYTSEQLQSVMLAILNLIAYAANDENRDLYTKSALLLVSNRISLPSDSEIAHSFKIDDTLGIGEEIQEGRYFYAMHRARGIVQGELGREIVDSAPSIRVAEKTELFTLSPEACGSSAVHFSRLSCAAKWQNLRKAYGSSPLSPPSPAKNAQILAKAFYRQGVAVPSRGATASTRLPLHETATTAAGDEGLAALFPKGEAGAATDRFVVAQRPKAEGGGCGAGVGGEVADVPPVRDPSMSGAGDSPYPWEREGYEGGDDDDAGE